MSTLLQKSSKKSLIREYGEALLVALVLYAAAAGSL